MGNHLSKLRLTSPSYDRQECLGQVKILASLVLFFLQHWLETMASLRSPVEVGKASLACVETSEIGFC